MSDDLNEQAKIIKHLEENKKTFVAWAREIFFR